MSNGLEEGWIMSGSGGMTMEQDEQLIRITVRSPKQRRDFEIIDTVTVRQLKDQIAVEFSAALDQQCIIFAGKILKDYERLRDCGVTDGMTVHLVIKSAHRATEGLPTHTQDGEGLGKGAAFPPADVGATPFGLAAVGGLAGLSNIGMGSANFIDLQQSLQKELFRNPRLLISLMNNPLVDQITSSPGLMNQLLAANPQMRELMERNPEIGQMLSNLEIMSQMLEVARNPAMLRELLRPQDRPINMDTADSSGVPGDETGASSGSGSKEKQKSASKTSTSGIAATSVPSDGSVFSEPGIRSLMLQMLEQPQLMNNVLQAPYMQSMLQHMSANPQLMSQMLSYNQIFANNPALMQQAQQNIPVMCQQLGSSETQSLVTNPKALHAMIQIQEGLEQLRTEVPQLVTRLGISPSIDQTTAGASQLLADPYSQFLSHVISSCTAAAARGDATVTPNVEKYATQLSQLSTMGFTDAEANLQALVATSGNLNDSINKLLRERKIS